jgi:8-oxo-dGTP pyrophosphatase MutT (NUDIX family)
MSGANDAALNRAPLDRESVVARLKQPAPPPDKLVQGDHHLNPGMAIGADLTPAAVLVPLVARPDGLTMLFTQRTGHLAHHAGQISFPGGHAAASDETPEATALRETEEEIGLSRRGIEVVGRLNTYITRTGFAVTPVVGFIAPPFTLAPDPHEVADVFEVPLAFLLDPANHQRHSRAVGGIVRQFYAMPYREYYIWGATAGMLMNLYQVLRTR